MGRRLRRGGGTAAVMLVLAAGVAACGEDVETAGPEAGTSLAELVADDGDRLLGRTVTVSAEVERVIDERAFYLGQDSEDTLLVIGSPRVTEAARVGAPVRVTGAVREFRDGVEERFGIDLSDEAFSDYGEENYIEAEAVERLSGAGGS